MLKDFKFGYEMFTHSPERAALFQRRVKPYDEKNETTSKALNGRNNNSSDCALSGLIEN